MTTAAHDHLFILYNLISKDFKIRYRNMSLGIFWSLMNPLIMMTVLTFVFTNIFPSNIPKFPLFLLIALVPFNFFSLAWSSGTNSIVENAALVKKVRFHREVIPISVVLGNVIHFLIQFALVLLAVLVWGHGFSRQWAWLPVVLGLEILLACGMALAFSALDVYYRDTRYVVESSNLVLFWMVPIFYPIHWVSNQYRPLYEWNPMTAVVHACRLILLDGVPPPNTLLLKLTLGTIGVLIGGFLLFRRMNSKFADYL